MGRAPPRRRSAPGGVARRASAGGTRPTAPAAGGDAPPGHLVAGAEIDDGAQPQQLDVLEVGGREPVQPVGAEQAPPLQLPAIPSPVASQITEVPDPLQLQHAGGIGADRRLGFGPRHDGPPQDRSSPPWAAPTASMARCRAAASSVSSRVWSRARKRSRKARLRRPAPRRGPR